MLAEVKTKLQNFNLPELKFEEERHLYWLNGEEIPSVSTVMKPISSSVYGEVDAEVLNRAAARGTAVHQAIETYLNFGFEDIPFSCRTYLDAFIQFYEDYRPEVVSTEFQMYHKYLRYAGTCDLLATIEDKLWLIDYKTSYKVEKMLTRVQLEAYRKALATHGIKVEGKAILHLQKSGKYKFVPHEMNDPVSWEVFTASKKVYDYIKNGGK